MSPLVSCFFGRSRLTALFLDTAARVVPFPRRNALWEFARPLLQQLEWPTLLCHKLEVVNDRIVNYKLRVNDQKKKAVAALKSLNYNVVAAGDAYNDTAMLKEANVGFLFRAPENVRKEFRQFKAVETYRELLKLIKAAL